MKIIKEKTKDSRTLTLRIAESTMEKVDMIAKKNNLSRQKLIEAILEQVVTDKNFVLKIKD